MVTGVDAGKLGAFVKTSTGKTMQAGVAIQQGGDDSGPTPHEMLEGALASCTVITVKMYASRKGWPLLTTHVTVATLSEDAESKLSRTVRFEGPLDEEQRARLLDIANKCPVHKLLSSHITIETKLG